MENGNWIAIRKSLAMFLPKGDRPFTVIEAIYSLSIDLENGGSSHSVNGYASLWAWDRRKVKKLIGDCGLKIESRGKNPGPLKRTTTGPSTAQRPHNGLLVFPRACEVDCTTTVQQPCNETYTPIKNRKNNKDIVVQAVSYLNTVTGKAFRPGTRETRRHLNARINEGHTLEDFKTVIDNRLEVWGNDSKMTEYLRPATLFGPKFESYLQVAKPSQTTLQPKRGLPEWTMQT